MKRTTRVAVPAVWLALWSVACGESPSDPMATDTPASSGTDVSPTTTAPPDSTLSPVPSTGVTPATTTDTTSSPTPSVTPPAMTTSPDETVSPVTPTPSVAPTTDPVDPTPTPSETDTGSEEPPPMGSEEPPPMGSEEPPPMGSEEPPPVPVEEPTLITSGENNYWQIGEPTMGGGNATVTVNADQEQQDWDGFGGTFNEAGWDALGDVSAEERDRAIRLLFHKTEGAGFTYGRIPIGSSDYGLDRYSLAETANDFEMNDFSIERDRQALIPYIQAALAVKPDIKFWGSPWSPPPWMKQNASSNGYDRGNMKNDPQTLGAHALYLARFVEEYAKEGIIVEHVQPQNEPGYLQDYPSCGWSAEQMTTYVRDYLGPLFAERLPNTGIWLGTLSHGDNDDAVGKNVVNDPGARAFLSGVGMQWGMRTKAPWYVQQGLSVMQTEHQCGNFPSGQQGYESRPAPNDHAYALESWGLLYEWINNGVNSYLAWNMVLDTFGRNLDEVRPWNQNALLVVDRAEGTLRATPTYYVFRHLAQYVEPGAKRVATQGGQALSFKNPDGSIVTVIHNNGGSAAQTTLAVGGTTLQFEVPARGWATVNWQAE